MANTWNQSGTTWGQNSYGLQTEVLIPITGLSTTSTVGSLDSSGPQQGWGAEAWGFENWGESAIDVILPGLTATTNIGEIITIGYADVVITGNTNYSDVDVTAETSYTDVTHVA